MKNLYKLFNSSAAPREDLTSWDKYIEAMEGYTDRFREYIVDHAIAIGASLAVSALVLNWLECSSPIWFFLTSNAAGMFLVNKITNNAHDTTFQELFVEYRELRATRNRLRMGC